MATFSVLSKIRLALATAVMVSVVGIATAFAQTTVTAAWDANTDPYTAGYRLYYGTAAGSYQWSVDAGNQTAAPINLSPGTRYFFTVRAYNAQYEYGPPSSEATVDLRGPAPTAQITASLQSATTALVTWQTSNAVTVNINGTAVGASGSVPMPVSGQTTFTITAAASDGRTATASATVSPTAPPTAQITATINASNVATVTWQTTNAVLANINGQTVETSGTATVSVTAPTTFTLTASGPDGRTATASASVTPVAAPAPTAQITATLQANNMALVTWQTANAAAASINSQTVALSGSSSVGITANTTFTITARAADGRTATASASVTLPAATAPGLPRNLAGTVSRSVATLTWQAPSTGGTPSGYLLYVGTASGWSNVANGYDVGNVLSVFGSLPRGTYYARVRAANAAGTSLSSNEIRFSIGRRLRAPSGFTVSWSGTTATLTWTASAADSPDDVPTNYVIEAGSAPGATDVARVDVGNATSFSTQVTSGNYYVRVRAQNELGESDPSNEIEVRTPGTPQAPTGLYDVGSGGTVDLRWTRSTGGYAASGYVIEAGSAPGLSDLARLTVGTETRFVTAAPPGVYYVRVRALNATGASLPSNEIVVRR